MQWFQKEKLIKEIKDYLQDNILHANKGVARIEYAFRFDQGLKEILEKYYVTENKN
jgi:hypothetical protein